MWRKFFLSIIIFAIITSTKSAVIECQWNGEQCDPILSITPVTIPNEVVTIVGKPANYINTATTSAGLSDFVLNYFPTGLFNVFPNLISFSMNNCQKTTLIANTVMSCGHLENFFITKGIIQNIPEGFIQTCTQLSVLFLSSNGIETIDKNAFKGLTKMTAVELSSNNLTCIPADLFQNLPALRNIYLLHNKIKTINSGTFRNLPSMMYVTLGDNLLQFLPTFDLNGTSTQMDSYIAFENNPIYAISPDFTSIYPKRSSLPGIGFGIGMADCMSEHFSLYSNNYMEAGPYLQKCYQNWTSSMTGNVACGQSTVPVTTAAPACAIASFWQKLLDYLKSVKVI